MKKDNEAKKFDKCLDISDRWDLFFTERVSMVFAKLFVKLDWHPNTVTIIGGIIGVAGGLLFAFDSWVLTIVAVLLCILYAILDCADGQVARMSKKGSLFGRCLDGFIDNVVYICIYFGIGHHLQMWCDIPFTSEGWYWKIWPLLLITALFFHTPQARTADYYRNVHMYLSANDRGHELSRSKILQKEIDEMDKPSIKRLFYKTYCSYTHAQERGTKNLQVLLNKIEENGGVIPEEISAYYRSQSNKIARLCNALVFNVRSYVLFALAIAGALTGTGLASLIIPFVILVLDPIRHFLHRRYEKIAKECIRLMDQLDGNE